MKIVCMLCKETNDGQVLTKPWFAHSSHEISIARIINSGCMSASRAIDVYTRMFFCDYTPDADGYVPKALLVP